MTRALALSLLALTACAEAGSFVLQDGLSDAADPADDGGDAADGTDDEGPADDPSSDTDPGTGDDTDPADTADTATPGDTPPPAVSADNCGPYAEPPGSPSVWISGDVQLELQGGFGFDWEWTGCEAERRFDAQGQFLCEIVREAEGEIINSGFGGPDFVYRVELTVDPSTTTCLGAQDRVFRYGFDVDYVDDTLDLQRAPANGGGFSDLTTTPFTADGFFTEVAFDYLADVTP